MQTVPQGQSERPAIRLLTRVDSTAFAAVAESLLRQGTEIRFVARGRSMTPSIRDGDTVTASPWHGRGRRAAPGAIVLAVTGNGMVLHRVIGRRTVSGRNMVVLQGDSAAVCSEVVPADAVIGTVARIERAGLTFNPNRLTGRMKGLLRSRLKRLRTSARLTLDVLGIGK